jgi:hypothetical protein
MNHRLKLDTTVLQSNTSMHLVQYIIEQRKVINEFMEVFNNAGTKITDSHMKELNEDFEFIMRKHSSALHKRCGTNIYPKLNGYKGGPDTEDKWSIPPQDEKDDDRDDRWEDKYR